MRIWSELLNLFFPPLCAACGERLIQEEECLCLTCLAKLPVINNKHLQDDSLGQLLAGRFPFRDAISYTIYHQEGMMQQIVHRLKYQDDPKLAFFMGKLCGSTLLEAGLLKNTDVLVPVPLHAKRLKERGYNQSEEFAKGISWATNIPMEVGVLKRVVNNPPQAKTQSRMERWQNVRNIFSVEGERLLEGKHILLIDDVITTGSTIEASARSLLSIKDVKISILSLSKV